MSRNVVPESELLVSIRSMSDEASARAKDLKAEAREEQQISNMWSSIASFLDKNWPMHVLALMDKRKNLIDISASRSPEKKALIQTIRQHADSDAANIIRRFPTYLEKACKEAGILPDRDSRHPRYTFSEGFFKLEINDRTRLARLSDREGRLDQQPADIGAILDSLKREQKRVFDRPFDGEAFLAKLRQQYLALLEGEALEDGDSVPIRQITSLLGNNEKGFRRDEFLVDLSRLVSEGPLDIENRRLDLQQTKNSKKGMLLHGPGSRGFVGYVVFREVLS